MGDPKRYQFDLPATQPASVIIPQQWYPGVQNYWPLCTTKRIVGDHITGVVAIVIHATAGATSEGAVSVMHPAPGNEAASFHWLVPDEDEPQHGKFVWACVREQDAAWHVRNSAHHPDVNTDKTRVNHWSLGIEVVNRQSGGDTFSEWQLAATAQIVRYCWARYPNLRHVISHAKLDPERRADPGANFPWERFKEMVLDTNREPLATIAAAAFAAAPENFLDELKNASLEFEEANYERCGKMSDKVHSVENLPATIAETKIITKD